MLVPSMTLEEIKNSLVIDYNREMKMKLQGIRLSRGRIWLQKGRKDFKETIIHTAQSKNQWCITVQYKEGVCSVMTYLVAYDHVGVIAVHFPDDYASEGMLYFNTHFFKRYRERAKLDIDSPEKLVRHFFKHNLSMIPCYSPLPDGSQQLFCPLNGGLGLGIFHEELKLCEFKTFVDESLLKHEQKQEMYDIYQSTLNDMMVEWQRRLKNPHGFKL